MNTLLARQSIYDRDRLVRAYELLYREGQSTMAHVDNLDLSAGDAATSSVITQLFTNLNMDDVIGNKLAFINFTYNHLVNQVPKLLPKNQIIIEVIESIQIDDQLIRSLIDLSKEGYQIALDDFIYTDQIVPLIQVADIIKIEVLHQNKDQIRKQLSLLQNFKGRLLAEKIENRNQFNDCMELGFDYFQGFFLSKPDPLRGQAITENRAHLIRLFGELNDPVVAIEHIENLILQIPKLSYRILRLVNSVAFYNGKKIESILDAIKLLGIVCIRNWIGLLMLSSIHDVELDLLERTLIRAKMCENLANVQCKSDSHLAYTVGILSTLDAILHEPMDSLLAKIQLSTQLNNAILYLEGELGNILRIVMDYEVAHFNQLESASVDNSLLMRAYLDSVKYAIKTIHLIK
ncbi:EAL and HDOD domain-containing protein [Legionella cherrii]|uniref:Putative Diguanylate phosphodiesterase (EAL domain) n=1 Tax=Legionella cherrii TaxID=28084 RepID=A0A0W0SAA0_9GAMM|nr:HDOD domain-containing protein [Legionella cherrii]KTC79829.1 putative Diguanylate phosphodiesterase (EAL domain) [Legionella cherrii]VEB38064.1 putative signal transduction protein [Legionella cherrii]